MTTMRSMNPEAPRFVDASSAAARYASFVNEPKYQVANKFFDDLNKEKLAEEARAEELRRYNQEFGLKQAAANREQAKYDRELNTDKALLDFQNIIRGTSQGGILNNNEGMSLANEYQKLVGTVGEEKAAEVINNKAQMLAQLDAKRAQSDPFYAANKIQGLTINGDRYGSIDPTKLINMQTGIVNDYVKRGESLRDHNATQNYRNQTLALDREKMNNQMQIERDKLKAQNESKNTEQILKEQTKNMYIQQMIALDKDPRGYTYDQMKAIVDEASKTKDFTIENSKVDTTDANGNPITVTQPVWVAKDKAKSQQDIAKQEQDLHDNYTKLINSKVFHDVTGADSDSKAVEIVDIARQAKIPSNILENIVASKNAENASAWFKESITYDDLNKFRVQDTKNKDKWYSLGDYLETLRDNPQFFEEVVSGQNYPNVIRMTTEEIKANEKKKKTKIPVDDNPWRRIN